MSVPSDAVATLERALAELDAHWPESERPAAAWIERGRLLHKLQRNTSALQALDRGLHLDPEAVDGWMVKAMLFEELGRLDFALDHYEHVLHLAPGHGAAWSNRAGLLLQMGRVDEALRSLERARDLDPDNVLLAFNHGLLLWQGLRRAADALPWIQRAAAAGVPEAALAEAECRAELEASAGDQVHARQPDHRA